MNEKIFYQLITKDGLKSDIRLADCFRPYLHNAIRSKYSAFQINEINDRNQETANPLGTTTFERRTYRMRRHYTVEFVEYEEE